MTEDSMAVFEAIQQSESGDFLREIAQHAVQRLMEFEVDGLCGAAKGERTPERQNYRNGHRERRWETRLGSLDLRIPKLRSGTYFPSFLEPRKSSEKALAAVIQEAYITGTSTRKMDDLVQSFGMTGISKSQVSELCKEIDERVQAFLNRPLSGNWKYIWLDAIYLKVREGGRVISVATIVAVGVNEDGYREILGLGRDHPKQPYSGSISSGPWSLAA